MTVDPECTYIPVEGLCIVPVSDDRFAIWNRYAPVILFTNQDSIELLKYMNENHVQYKKYKGFKRILRQFIKSNIIYPKNNASFREILIESGNSFLLQKQNQIPIQAQEKTPFAELCITNQRCNLGCPYCIVAHNEKRTPPQLTQNQYATKIKIIKKIIAQFANNQTHGNKKVNRRIQFNGGEFLLDFNILKFVVDHVKQVYPNKNIEFGLNTNATLITEEIAEYLNKNFNDISISIDGYEELNNKTRKYHNGKGAFKDILRGVTHLRKNHPDKHVRFQGTLEAKHVVDFDRLLELEQYGFKQGRLGINLLGIEPEAAVTMADKHFDLCMQNANEKFTISDWYINTYLDAANQKHNSTSYTPPCKGLMGGSNSAIIYNIDLDTLGTLCSFAPTTTIPAKAINHNIYHERLFESANQFLEQRFQTFLKHCLDCELTSICRGGCLMSGIDSHNQLNPAACAFRKQTWHRFLQRLHCAPNAIKKQPIPALHNTEQPA